MDKRFLKPNQADEVEWHNDSSVPMENGWGLVVQSDEATLYSYGVVPREILELFRKRKQYILSFCDNMGVALFACKGHEQGPRSQRLGRDLLGGERDPWDRPMD